MIFRDCIKLIQVFIFVIFTKPLNYFFTVCIQIGCIFIEGYTCSVKARIHRDEYRRALFASVFQRVFCVHTQAIFADDEPSEHANSFPDIRWRLM